jgi:tetratricopeptide (TPR) repeat protein
MLLARSGVSLLIGLAALAVAAVAAADPPAPDAPTPGGHDGGHDGGSAPPLQVATDKDRARRAMALHDEAWALYEEGRYRAAIEKLEAALTIDPDARELVYNLALLHEKLADVKEAIAYYRRYLEKETDPKARARVQATVRRLEGAAREAAAREALSPLRDPAPPPPPPPRPVRPWVVATGALAGTAFVLGAVFGFSALARNPGANARTGGSVTIGDLQAAANAAHSDAVVADVSFLAAAASAGAAIFLYLATPRRAQLGPAQAAHAVALGPRFAGVSF